jgi:hypothetical protein
VLDVEAGTISGWINGSLSKWRRFVKRLSGQDTLAIMDGAFLQCGLGDLLERGADDRTMLDYGRMVAEVLRPLNPVLAYLFQPDMDAALATLRRERSKAWVKRVEAHFEDTAYGRSRSATGFGLYVEFNRSLREISQRFLEAIKVPMLLLDRTDRVWSNYADDIGALHGRSRIIDPFNPHDYCGEYVSNESDKSCRIEVIDGLAHAEGLFKIDKTLLPRKDDTLFVQAWPDELTFARDRTGEVKSFRSTGPWNRIGDDIWIRIDSGESSK